MRPETVRKEIAGSEASLPSLTAGEVRVLRLIVAGKTNQEIADTLGISPNTVRSHLEHVGRKVTQNACRDQRWLVRVAYYLAKAECTAHTAA